MTNISQIIEDIKVDYRENLGATSKEHNRYRGEWIPISWIRESTRCSRYQRRDLDTALIQMARTGAAHLEIDPLPGRLTEVDQDGAVRVGGERCQLIAIF